SLWTVLNWLSRNYSFDFFALPVTKILFIGRYGFPVSSAFLILWVTLVFRLPWKEQWKLRAAGWLAVTGFLLGTYRMAIGPFGTTSLWSQHYSSAEQSYRKGCPHSVTIPIQPEGWSLTYSSPNPSCP